MTRDLDTEGPVAGQQRIDVGALRHMSLCAGMGGIDIALERAFGAETVAVSDIDPGACKILAHRYPHVPNIGDMTAVNWHEWVGKVDIISGGTPCQDLSSAGRRRGMTEGTRSNLWVAMRDAIATIKPALVVWENVRGAFSATADSDLEPCAGCVGERTGEPVLRALGRVLGDLSDLGYDAWWYGLRASDVGAAHHRFRVFVFAVKRESVLDPGHRSRCAEWGHELSDDNGSREPGEGASDAIGGRLRRLAREARRGEVGRDAAAGSGEVSDHADSDSGGRGSEWWLDAIRRHAHRPGRTDGLRGATEPTPHVNLPSPTANLGQNGGGQHPDKRKAGGHSVSIEDAVHALPTPRATDGTKGGPNQRGSSGDVMLPSAVQDWREYEPAIRRQEQAFGYPAPLPTEPNKNGKPRLSAEFSSWLMGLEPGWITDVPGITRNEALKAAGNGVVPQQCEAAARRFLSDYEATT